MCFPSLGEYLIVSFSLTERPKNSAQEHLALFTKQPNKSQQRNRQKHAKNNSHGHLPRKTSRKTKPNGLDAARWFFRLSRTSKPSRNRAAVRTAATPGSAIAVCCPVPTTVTSWTSRKPSRETRAAVERLGFRKRFGAAKNREKSGEVLCFTIRDSELNKRKSCWL